MSCLRRKSCDQQEKKINSLVGSLRSVSPESRFIFRLSHYASGETSSDDTCPFVPLAVPAGTTGAAKALLTQTYSQWKSRVNFTRTLALLRRKPKILLLPLDHFPLHVYSRNDPNCLLQKLCQHMRAFFPNLDVSLSHDFLSTSTWNITRRVHPVTKQNQLLVTDLQRCLRRHVKRLHSNPKLDNHFATIAITWTDLYPSQDMNFVLGDTDAINGVAVICCGRYYTNMDPTTVDPTKEDPTNMDPTTVNPTNMDPTTVDPTNMDPTTVDPTNMDPTKEDPSNMDSTTVDPTNMDPTKEDPSNMDSTTMDPSNMDPTTVDPTNMDSTKVDPTNMDPTNMDPSNMDPTTVDPSNMDPTTVDPSNMDPTTVDPTNMDSTKVDSTNMDPTNMDPTNMDPTKVDPTTVDPTNMDPTNMDPNTVDPTNMDPTTVDPMERPASFSNKHKQCLSLWKMIKVFTHEACHLLHVHHCDGYFSCLMQCSTKHNSILLQPNFLCPVCLRKLHRCFKFEPKERYLGLMRCYVRHIDEMELQMVKADRGMEGRKTKEKCMGVEKDKIGGQRRNERGITGNAERVYMRQELEDDGREEERDDGKEEERVDVRQEERVDGREERVDMRETLSDSKTENKSTNLFYDEINKERRDEDICDCNKKDLMRMKESSIWLKSIISFMDTHNTTYNNI